MGGSTSKCLLYRADTRAWPAGRTSPRRQTYHPSAPPNLGGMALATPEASAFRGPPSTRPAPPPRPSRHRVRPAGCKAGPAAHRTAPPFTSRPAHRPSRPSRGVWCPAWPAPPRTWLLWPSGCPRLPPLHATASHALPAPPGLSPCTPGPPALRHDTPRPLPPSAHRSPPLRPSPPLTAQPARPRHRFHPARSPRPSRPAAHRATGSSPAVSCGTIFNGTNPKARVRKGISRSRAQTKCYQYIRVPCGHVRHAI
jgi:hypothetical protein